MAERIVKDEFGRSYISGKRNRHVIVRRIREYDKFCLIWIVDRKRRQFKRIKKVWNAITHFVGWRFI